MIDARIAAGNRRWAAWVAGLCLAGAWNLAVVPPQNLKGHRDMALAWTFTLACGGVAAEALWNARGHRRTASLGMLWGTLAVWSLVITAADPWPIPGVPFWILLPLTVTAYPVVRHASEPV
ncbi:MAG TPA: hypothetical protein VFJ16_14460 [Longimicrobium sp.]|nr:hypothetical protein [Longimicrobium sp.]